ncbi:MAG: [Agathobacter sp.]|nr:[FeFe] hydrogenase H-cluster maturation GTPase HydF [Agathobacter sp.]
MSLNTTPSANRLHIGIFGKVNSGKSTFLNTFTGQDISIVSNVAGTTTDVVTKVMEIAPLGPCVFMDTAGFDDVTELGEARKERTRKAVEKCDMAILVISMKEYETQYRSMKKSGSEAIFEALPEKEWYLYFKEKKIPVVIVINTFDEPEDEDSVQLFSEASYHLTEQIRKFAKELPIFVDAKTGDEMEVVKDALVRNMPEGFELPFITGDLVGEDDTVMLVMPQDVQAPKGRLILPQVQTIRELLDKKCIVISVTPEKMKKALIQEMKPPKLIITDSQVFQEVYENKPEESMLTSFSVLFAAYKGDLPYYVEGAKAIDSLNNDSRVLIAECCTHAPLSEDIGRVKIPNMLRKRFGTEMKIDIVSGTDFPRDLRDYDLIIQCGGCMFNRRYVMSRIERAKEQHVPMTNYGVTIAHLTGILDKISM